VTRRLVVSDIHGEGHRLLQALKAADYEPGNDRLFLLGDYIDRGTDSKVTVDIVRRLVADGAIALRGNHDTMPGIVRRDTGYFEWWVRNGGKSTIDSYGGKMPPDDVIDWLESLPLYHEEPDYILVHAGLEPGVPLAEQAEEALLWIREEFLNGYTGKRVIFGHTPTMNLHQTWEPWVQVDKTGIDTGAAYDGKLTVLDLDTLQTWTA
jgi:serine/threonine protein phosphatase 1